MSIEIKLAKVFDGECIWVRYGVKDIVNIVIDSGPSKSWNEFKHIIEEIKKNNERVNLLILTHIHDDHINGFRRYLTYSKDKMIDKIWINGDKASFYNNQVHSVGNIGGLIEKINSKAINLVTPILSGMKESIGEGHITVITPEKEDMLDVATEIEKASIHSTKDLDLRDIDEIIKDDIYKPDTSAINKSSISFILSYNNKNIAFLGDAHGECIIHGINEYWDKDVIHLAKLPHHGSKKNVSIDLLNSLKCNNYIICHKNKVYKETISRIVQINDVANVYCNYNWWLDNYFTNNDVDKYIKTKKLNLEEKTKIVY